MRATVSNSSLGSVLSSTFKRSAFAAASLVLLCELLLFLTLELRSYSAREASSVRLIRDSISEPLLQGSFAEVSHRLNRLKSSGGVRCTEVRLWGFDHNDCSKGSVSFAASTVHQPLIETAIGSEDPGMIVVHFDRSELIHILALRGAFLVLLFGLLYFWLTAILTKSGRQIEREAREVVAIVDLAKDDENQAAVEKRMDALQIFEFSFLASGFRNILREVRSLNRKAAVAELAAQVAHDIASPLMALKVSEQTLPAEVENQRALMRSAIDRIDGIVSLLKAGPSDKLRDIDELQIVPALRRIVAEKQVEFSRLSWLRINLQYDPSLESAAARISANDFMSGISNLINNSIESWSTGELIVRIDVVLDGHSLRISVADNGRGIPSEVLPRLFVRGFSFGKRYGSGLGLSALKSAIDSAGGSISIDSTVGVGTKIAIRLPIFDADKK